jgi:hypothetical protein
VEGGRPSGRAEASRLPRRAEKAAFPTTDANPVRAPDVLLVVVAEARGLVDALG